MTPGADLRAATAFDRPSPHDHVFRNQSVGSRRSRAGSGPAVVHGDADEDVFRAAFAYSTNTSK